jgi:hypothetical protein
MHAKELLESASQSNRTMAYRSCGTNAAAAYLKGSFAGAKEKDFAVTMPGQAIHLLARDTVSTARATWLQADAGRIRAESTSLPTWLVFVTLYLRVSMMQRWPSRVLTATSLPEGLQARHCVWRMPDTVAVGFEGFLVSQNLQRAQTSSSNCGRWVQQQSRNT